MDNQFKENFLSKGDADFEYDKREDFIGEESNEWDDSISEF
jgi:hypothetical protein